ncbi:MULTISPECIES: hypothetical protein [unclassified Agarivorans]|uniref:hypothetical protein n=1 Tax=unclassified Agarivorans TaxID=2636026 RepID=UPI003D7E4620
MSTRPDGVYQHPNPPPDFVITEAKYGKSRLGKTTTGKQMSDDWVTDKRLRDAGITSRKERDRILDALDEGDGSVEKMLIRNKADGTVVAKRLDKHAKVVSSGLIL